MSRKHSFLLSIFLLFSLFSISFSWKDHDDIRTGKMIMYVDTSAPYFNASSVPLSYNISYSSALGNTSFAAGIGINGYQTYLTNDFSLNTTIENFTQSWLRVTFITYGDTLVGYFQVNWIAIGSGAQNFVDLNFDCFICSTLSTGNDTRTETQTGTTYFSGQVLQVTIYLSGFQVTNSEGITYYLNAQATVADGDSTIDYTFTTNQNNTVSSICYTTIIFCQACTQTPQYYYNWGQSGQQQLSQSLTPTVFSPQSRFESQNRMFFGMSSFNISRAADRIYSFKTDVYSNLANSYTTNHGTYSILVDYFWISVRGCNSSHPWFVVADQSCVSNNNCPAGTHETNPGSFCLGCYYTCQSCDGAHPQNCTGCNSTKFRFYNNNNTCDCESGYIDIGIQLCYPCEYYISGCDTCASTAVCTACFPGFILLSSGVCGCTTGYLVSGVCTNVTGCISALQYGGSVQCIACNTTLHFQITTTYTCSCTTGYLFDNLQNCDPICGDGLEVSEEGCDDGNTADGDGCSSTCTVESGWACYNGSTTSTSVCLIADAFTVTTKYVLRILTDNIMQVAFKITPEYSQFTTMNFKKNITHDVPATDFNATYENGLLIMDFKYTQTLESNSYTISIFLDADIFDNTTITGPLTASGMNAKLTYDTMYANHQPLSIAVIVLVIAGIIVTFVSMLSQKMIGVQLIQTMQTVLFAMAVIKVIPSTLSPLQNLQYSNGFNKIQGVDNTRTYTFAFSLSSIGLEKEFLLSLNLMYIILLIVIMVCIVAKVIQQYYVKKIVNQSLSFDDVEKYQLKLHKVTLVFNFVFERILLLLAFMLYFLVIFAIMVQLTDMSADYTMVSKQLNIFGAVIAVSIMITIIAAVLINGIYPNTRLFPLIMKRAYAPIYVIYQSVFIFVLAFNYTQQYTLYILVGLSFGFLIFNIVYQPYPQKFHLFVLVFHQIVILLALGTYIFEILTTPAQNELLLTILVYVLLFCLFICVFLNIYRIWRYHKYLKENNIDLYDYTIAPNSQGKIDDQAAQFLVSPKANTSTKNKSFVKKREEETQLKQFKKKSKLKNNRNNDVEWHENQLAQEEKYINATDKQPHPDTERERKLKDYYKNPYAEDEASYPAEKSNFQKYSTPQNKNREMRMQRNSDHQRQDSKNLEEDPLKLIKMKLKKEFNEKVGTSTLKQSQF